MNIIKKSLGNSVAIKVRSISTNITSQFEIGNFNTVKMMPNNNLLIGIGMDYIYSSEIKTQIQYYYSFKLEEVGISTPIKETTSTINSLKIFPIPSSSFLQIETLRTYDEIIIYGMNGSTIVKKTNENILDLSNLEAGEYFLDLISNGLSIGKQKFIKL